MLFKNEFISAVNSVINPKINSKHKSFSQIMSTYYKASIIPLIIAVVIGFAAGYLFGPFSFILRHRSAIAAGFIGGALNSAYAIIAILVIIPLSLIIYAAIYYIFADLALKIWKGSYEEVLVSFMYGNLLIVIFFFLVFIPIVSIAASIALSIWGIAVVSIVMGRQMKMDPWRAFGGMVVTGIVIIAIAMMLMMLLFGFAYLASSVGSGLSLSHLSKPPIAAFRG
ncbi:multipass membrane protein [Candidatus Mancarchaeum acidiphilum]|uniref:Multipass membrane protein n=1 Tax=Candidatus Mancarchaeum acidiphilum TaxID=1920749 RepID=A0A218NNQ4_9ARCH|nr:hypothetical protein [Candidatus Mancarchaeum acidiphilum]ASI14083.1 multipass membrane protein [Candidatus Mancarchaeum acidiphilum]